MLLQATFMKLVNQFQPSRKHEHDFRDKSSFCSLFTKTLSNSQFSLCRRCKVRSGTLTDSVLPDVSSQTSKVSDAAIDCLVQFVVVQQIIDSVHSFTGLNWWASIVLTSYHTYDSRSDPTHD